MLYNSLIRQKEGEELKNNLTQYISYWQKVFASDKPINSLGLDRKEMQIFDLDVPPEPYYGYFHEDMTNDVLILLFNPGAKEERTAAEGWNQYVKQRYTDLWPKKRYEEEEIMHRQDSNWRNLYLENAKNIVGDVGFLHTMEFFPFHSRKDGTSNAFKNKWANHESSELAFRALEDIANNHKVKGIFTLNNIWPFVLEKHNVPLTRHIELIKQGGKTYSFQFKMYQFNDDAVPVLSCRASGSMKLPTNEFAVTVARSLLDLNKNEPMPSSPDFDVKIY